MSHFRHPWLDPGSTFFRSPDKARWMPDHVRHDEQVQSLKDRPEQRMFSPDEAGENRVNRRG
jgi:hypothetical protein